MLRKEKIKMLKQIATGDTSELHLISKRYVVVFLEMYNDVLYYIDHRIYFKNTGERDLTNEQRQQIFDDPGIRKYTYNELKALSKRHFIFCMPLQMFAGTEAEIKEFYNKYFA